MKLLIVALALLLSGCSMLDPTNESRISEANIGGLYGALSGGGKTLRLVKEGEIAGCLEYRGENGTTYRSQGCADLPPLTTTTTTVTEPAQP